MDAAATRKSSRDPLSLFLAGLQAGMLGALLSSVCIGLAAVLNGAGFWNFANLSATAFYGGAAIRRGMGFSTLSGLALHLILYSLLGGAMALILRDRLPRYRRTLACILFALAWYYLAFGLLWTYIAPLLAQLHVESITLMGHLIYGAVLGRYPKYLPPASTEFPAMALEEAGEAPAAPRR